MTKGELRNLVLRWARSRKLLDGIAKLPPTERKKWLQSTPVKKHVLGASITLAAANPRILALTLMQLQKLPPAARPAFVASLNPELRAQLGAYWDFAPAPATTPPRARVQVAPPPVQPVAPTYDASAEWGDVDGFYENSDNAAFDPRFGF